MKKINAVERDRYNPQYKKNVTLWVDDDEFILMDSLDQFLSALGTVMNGTWSKEWNDTTKRFEFSFEAIETEP